MIGTGIAFETIRVEMARNNITITEIAKTLGIRRETLSKKLSMKCPILLSEAFIIQRSFFSEFSLEVLFKELKNAHQ